MSHALVTVFVPEGKQLEEMMAPFSEHIVVEEYDKPCPSPRVDHTDCYCDGTGIYRTTANPRGKHDYWTVLGESEYIDSRYPSLTGVTGTWGKEAHQERFEHTEPTRKLEGLTTFAILTSDEGWIDRQDAGLYGWEEGIDLDAQAQEWEEHFQRAYAHYSKLDGIRIVVCDYHS